MKLVHFGEKSKERAGVIDAKGRLRDVSEKVELWTGDTLGDESRPRGRRALRPAGRQPRRPRRSRTRCGRRRL